MSKDNVFDRLVKDLSGEERRKIVEKIEQNIHISQDPIEIPVEKEATTSIEDEYASLSWLDKLIIFIKTLFLMKDRMELTRNVMMNRLARQINMVCPGMIDVKKKIISGDLGLRVADIGKSVDFLKKPISICFGVDKVLFYSLMGQLEFPHLQKDLENSADPWRLFKEQGVKDPQDIKRMLNEKQDTLLGGISREDRIRMMGLTRVLNQLFLLSTHPFKDILSKFPDSAAPEPLPADFDSIRAPFTDFAHLILSVSMPPSVKLLEAVFFLYFEKMDHSDELSLEQWISQNLTAGDVLIKRIRNFNREVPVSDIMKVLHNDPFYKIPESGGGEDWFYFFRQYWMDRLADNMRIYGRDVNLEKFGAEFLQYWDLESLSFITEYLPHESHSVFAYSLGMLNTFHKEIYQKKLYYPMKILLIDGDFYKKSNREEYETMFQELLNAEKRISLFEKNLQPNGISSNKLKEAAQELRNDPDALEKKVHSIYGSVNRDVYDILKDALSCLTALGKIMNGIVLGNGGAYDTISNLSEIGGSENENLRNAILSCSDDIHKMCHVFNDALILEKEKLDEYYS